MLIQWAAGEPPGEGDQLVHRVCKWFGLLLILAVPLGAASTGGAAIAPPWCGTPMPDAAESLPSAPPFNFPHIPYYAIGCTLNDIAARSGGRMTVEVIGQSALGRDMYLVTINELKTGAQRRDFASWRALRALSNSRPERAQQLLNRFGSDVKIPLFIQGGIHGNEYEGVDANMLTIERLATTPYGTDPEVDRILDHSVVLFNVIQNPDGRIAGIRQNGDGFDLNRDFLTQSQPETKASVEIMQKWQPPDMLDLHGYLSPVLLIEATTKPHNPGIEYDLWLKWNQSRIDANEAALAVRGFGVQRPINDWCADAGDAYPYPGGLCPTNDATTSDDGLAPGPAAAEGWDDWGPFYTPMYSQLVGMNGSTVEMCRVEDDQCEGRLGARIQQENITWSTLLFNVANRRDVLMDQLEIYKRNVNDAPRPACCPAPFGAINNWMHDYPKAFLIPLGNGQRSDAEANRLVEWLLLNGVEVEELDEDTRFNGQRYEEGSYVVWIDQARRGLIDTALDIGVDISSRAEILYAPPGAWSHGYLWGADVVTIGDGARFSPDTDRIRRPNRLDGGIASSRRDDDDDRRSRSRGSVAGYLLELDSPTAVRSANSLIEDGVGARLVTSPFTTRTGGAAPAGSIIFAASAARKLDDVGEDAGLWFHPVRGVLPASEPIESVPRIGVLPTPTNTRAQEAVWTLKNLGFPADLLTTTALNNAAGPDPLANYEVLFTLVNFPTDNPNTPENEGANDTYRARVAAFFGRGAGVIAVGTGGATFVTSAGQLTGLTAASNSGGGFGYSGILNWSNSGGPSSVITGAYPALDTAIVDPPTWFTAVPAPSTGWRVDGTLPLNPFLAGLAPFTWPASGASMIAHGTNTAGNARITAFAMNPLYRADPEREWPMTGSALYWVDQ
jgi:hypothetical protein